MTHRLRRQQGVTLMELLVAMAIMGVISTMILVSWFALQDSFASSVTSNIQRENASQTLSRVQREIRDAEAQSGSNQPALLRAHPYYIAFYTTFNNSGNTLPVTQPRLVAYKLYDDGSLYKFVDSGTTPDGEIEGVDGVTSGTTASDDTSSYELSEQLNGEGATKVLDHIVNVTRPGGAVPVFEYLFYDAAGDAQYEWFAATATDRANTRTVTTRLLVDLNPGHSPQYADLKITSQMRNQR